MLFLMFECQIMYRGREEGRGGTSLSVYQLTENDLIHSIVGGGHKGKRGGTGKRVTKDGGMEETPSPSPRLCFLFYNRLRGRRGRRPGNGAGSETSG